MSIEATNPLPVGATLAGVFSRVEAMLRPDSAGGFSASEAPVTAAIRAAGRMFGAKPAAGIAPGATETISESIERISRSAGLIARETILTPDWRRTVALPVIARRRSDGAPLALVPRGGRWMVVDGSAPRRPVVLSETAAADIETGAWIVGPALPDKAITWKQLFLYGWTSKISDLSVYAMMSLLAGLALACVPIANNAVTGIVIPGRDLTLLQHIFAMLIALMLASLATRLSAALCELRINGRTGSMLRTASADRMIRLLRDESKASMSPAASALITRCMETWHRSVWHLVLTIVSGLLVSLPSLLMMTRTSPVAALLLLVIMLAAIGASVMIARRQVENLFAGPCSPTSWISMSYEALSQIVTVRALGAEARFFKLFSESFLALKDRFLVSDRMGAQIYAIEAALEAFIVAVAIGTIVYLNRGLSANDSVAFTMAVMTVAGATVTIVHGFSQASMIGLQHRMIQPILSGVPTPAASGSSPGVLSGEISVHDLVVRHDPNGRATLEDVSLRIAAGQHIGIVGPSGSGKTTLLNAILGLARTESGQIAFDGADLDQLDVSAVRRQIGVVGQAGRLFPGTIQDNIAAGATMSQSEAWAALRTAALEHDVRAMPLGLSTPIGDADPVLSTGQVQRLLLARAVAQRPRILILDEATSALDPQTEAQVATAIAGLNATVIAVAHRLDTVRHCDCIYVIDNGRIVESGTFSELSKGTGVLAGLAAAEARAQHPIPRHASNDALARLQTLQREFKTS